MIRTMKVATAKTVWTTGHNRTKLFRGLHEATVYGR